MIYGICRLSWWNYQVDPLRRVLYFANSFIDDHINGYDGLIIFFSHPTFNFFYINHLIVSLLFGEYSFIYVTVLNIK